MMTQDRESAAMSPDGAQIEALAELIRTFNDQTERLRESHDRLQRRVVELQRELDLKNRELERKNRLAVLGEMAACLAHEVRNPLGGIELYVSLIERRLQGQEDATGWVRKVRGGLSSLNSIVGDMLQFTGRLDPRPETVRPSDLVLGALALAAAEGDRRVRVEISEALPRVRVDRGMVQRVFLNLILNALQAVGAEAQVVVRGVVEAGVLVISVRDNGPGIPAEALPHLFTPFFTRRARGTGLGLAIAHRIIEAHGGTIQGTNHPDGGAIFRVALPLEGPSAEEVP